jgi:HPt (histidine-containing phosphotransfer) domain-containing protein
MGKNLEKAIARVVITTGIADSMKPEQDATTANVIVWDAVGTLERLGGDEALFRNVTRIFLEEIPNHLTALHRAIKESDVGAIERIAHTLKGDLGYLGICSLRDKARELESMGKESHLRNAGELFAVFETGVSTVVKAMRETRTPKRDGEQYPIGE